MRRWTLRSTTFPLKPLMLKSALILIYGNLVRSHCERSERRDTGDKYASRTRRAAEAT
jgi:hypothetical protein